MVDFSDFFEVALLADSKTAPHLGRLPRCESVPPGMQVGTYLEALALLYPLLTRDGPVAAIIDGALCDPGRQLRAGDVVTVFRLGDWSHSRREKRMA